MSKKMLKRSLALGALMAFVITGSAMAAEKVWDSGLNIDKVGEALEYSSLGHSGTVNVGETGSITSGSICSYNNFSVTAKDITVKKADGTGVQTALDSKNHNFNINFYNKFDVNMTDKGHGIVANAPNATIDIDGNGTGSLSVIADENAVSLSRRDDYINDSEVFVHHVENNKINIHDVVDVYIESKGEDEAANDKDRGHAIYAHNDGGQIIVDASGDLTVKAIDSKYAVLANGNNSVVTLNADATNITGTVAAYGSALDTNGTSGASENITVNLKGNYINLSDGGEGGRAIQAKGEYYGNNGLQDNAVVNIGTDSTKQINIKDTYYGIMATYDGAKVEVKGAELNIANNNASNAVNAQMGLYAMNGTYNGEKCINDDGDLNDNAQVIIGKNTNTKIILKDANGNASGFGGIVSYSQGKVEVNGNLEVVAETAIRSRTGYVNINKANDNDVVVKLDGDIIFDYGNYQPLDADVNVNLANKDSYLKGNIFVNTDGIEVTGMNLSLSNGATWELDKASIVNNAIFSAESNLVLKGDGTQFTTAGDFALNGAGTEDVLKVDSKANIKVEGIDYKKYNIATGFEKEEATKTYWNVSNLNTLMQGNWIGNAKDGLQLEVVAKEAEQMATEMGVSSSTAQSLENVTKAAQQVGCTGDVNGTGEAKAVALINAMSGVDSKVAGQVFEAVSKMAEAGGNSGTAASIVKNVTGVTNDRLSFNCGHSAPHKGGHGVGLFEEGSGADVWVEYVHGKDEVEDMPSTAGASSYEGQYNGIVMGVDFKKVNKFQSGLAFNYGEGDTNSVGSAARTHSDYDFWGIGYYGSIHNDDSNVIFDIGYAKTDSDVETNALGINYKASPETTTWTAGVKVEKLYQNENVQIVPYTGLRFMSIDPEDYSTECASSKYDMERQNVWLLPLGVSIKQEIANDNGWTVSPKVDLSYIWAFGDTDSEMEFSTLGTKTNIGYEVMDDGSFLGLVGIEAHKGQWGFGVSYSYQKGDYSTSKKWFIDANYSF